MQRLLLGSGGVLAAGVTGYYAAESTRNAAAADAAASPRKTEPRLVRGVVIARHGERSPTAVWHTPVGNYKMSESEKTLWKAKLVPAETQALLAKMMPYNTTAVSNPDGEGAGLLTTVGGAQHTALGEWLRSRWETAGLFEGGPPSAFGRSTPYPRCIQSLQHLLLALVPETFEGGGTLPISVRPLGEETAYGVHFTEPSECWHARELITSIYKFASVPPRVAQSLKKLRDTFGTDDTGGFHMLDAMNCQLSNGFELAGGLSAEEVKTLCDDGWGHWAERYTGAQGRLLVQMMAGPFIPELVGFLEGTVQRGGQWLPPADPTSAPKVVALVAHDTVPLLPLYGAIGINNGKWPSYAESLVLEVLEDERQQYVRVLRDKNLVAIPDCAAAAGDNPELCPLDTFRAILEKSVAPKGSADLCAKATAIPEDRLRFRVDGYPGSAH